jgi:FG-GAP-like repeat
VSNEFPDYAISIMLGDGRGGFTKAGSLRLDSPGTPDFLAVGDFNNDGRIDLAATGIASAGVSILLGNGSGGFASPIIFDAGIRPRSIIVADFNGDGKSDLAAGDAESRNVFIF